MSETPAVSPVDRVDHWLGRLRERTSFQIAPIPFAASCQWCITPQALSHRTGAFFTIRGIRATSQFPGFGSREQPIICQPEVGILGFLAQRPKNEWQLLVQAKAEPGNVGLIQMAPTVQATHSNYTQRHGGRKPDFVDTFLYRQSENVLVDQLQSEQGSRFLAKRNRNMVVELHPGSGVSHGEEFSWLTLGELRELLQRDFTVNSDARSVLACFASTLASWGAAPVSEAEDSDRFTAACRRSLLAAEREASRPLQQILGWITDLRLRYELRRELMDLKELRTWRICDDIIRPESADCFVIRQYQVHLSGREVSDWDQPLVSDERTGLIALLWQERNGVLHVLVQARVEPGTYDTLELTASVQCQAAGINGDDESDADPLAKYVLEAPRDRIQLSSEQSEEGGRFYRSCTRYLVVELPESERMSLPDNYAWLTLGQTARLLQFSNMFTNEVRGLLAYLLLSALSH